MRRTNFPRQRITSATVKIICHGNSHTAGEGASSTSTRWTAMMQTFMPLAGTGVTVINSGIPGQSTSEMIDNAPTAVDAHLDPTKLNILFGQEGGNEMAANGRNATAAHTKWVQYCNARRAAAAAANARLVIITIGIHPTAAGATEAITNQRMAANILYNQLLRANYRKYCDLLLDMESHEPFLTLKNNGDWSEAAFDATGMYNQLTDGDGTANDRVHLGNTGHRREGQAAAHAISRVRALPYTSGDSGLIFLVNGSGEFLTDSSGNFLTASA